MEQAGVRLGRQIDVEQRNDGLVTLGVQHRPLLEREAVGVEHQRDVGRAAEGRLILDLDRGGVVVDRHPLHRRVLGQIDVVLEQELQRRLGDEVEVLGVHLLIAHGDAAAVGDDLEPGRRRVVEQHPAGRST